MVLPDRVASAILTIASSAAIHCFLEEFGEEKARRYMEKRRRKKNLLEAGQGKVFRALRLSARARRTCPALSRIS